MSYVVFHENKYFGPVTIEELKFLLKKYKISLSNFVWNETNQTWKMLGELDEFKEFWPKNPKFSTDLPCFYIFLHDSIQGPLTHREIKQRLQSKTLSFYDFALLAGSEEWKRIKNFQEFYTQDIYPPSLMKGDFKLDENVLPKKELDFELSENSNIDQNIRDYKKRKEGNEFEIKNDQKWLIKFGNDEIGPVKFTDVIKMLQDHKISKSDYVKTVDEKQWRKISSVYEFNVEVAKKIIQSKSGDIERLFVKRSSPRVTYYSMCAVKSNDIVINGVCSSISTGGCFIETNSQKFKVGQRVLLTIRSGAIPMTIKAHAEVTAILDKKPRGLGIKFIEINSTAKSEIERFIDKFLTKSRGKN